MKQMIYEIIVTFLISISPLGEARVGIPYGVVNGLPVFWSFIIGWIANILVFPLFYRGISIMNRFFWRHRRYKKGAVYLSKKAKNKTQKSISKYGAWGLMVFVMIPLPITGAYVGTIAAYVLNIGYNKSLLAVTIGVTISSLIVAVALYFGIVI